MTGVQTCALPILRKDGLFTVFETGGTSYRIGGVKPLFVTSLRVNIRAGNGKVSYYDSIDLYASRGRSSFAQGLYRTWGISPERVETDLIKILELLEKERDERLLAKSRTQNTELTEEEKAMGLSLLRDRNLFRRITDDMTKLGYVGEELNKILLYLCASSRKLDDPISVLIISQSASGKSYLVDTVRRLMPPEEVRSISASSRKNFINFTSFLNSPDSGSSMVMTSCSAQHSTPCTRAVLYLCSSSGAEMFLKRSNISKSGRSP